jgi:hypothetical protein
MNGANDDFNESGEITAAAAASLRQAQRNNFGDGTLCLQPPRWERQ